MYYIFSDVHGCYDQMVEALKYWDKEKEQLVILGDLIDRGPESLEVINLAMELQKQGAIVLMGNHDQMFIEWLQHEEMAGFYFYEDARSTINSFFPGRNILNHQPIEEVAGKINRLFAPEVTFLRTLPKFYETENLIFVHAGIDLNNPDLRETPDKILLWIRNEFIFYEKTIGKRIFFGHTPTKYIRKDGKNDIWVSPNGEKVGIDGHCFNGGQLNAVKITETGEILETFAFKRKRDYIYEKTQKG